MEGTHIPLGSLSPNPRFPRMTMWRLGLTILRHGRQSLAADSASFVGALAGRWTAAGLEHVPPSGPVCLAINHWQRPGLWIGWPGMLLGWLVRQRRPQTDPPIRWLVLTELRLPLLGRERHLALGDIFLRRVAHAWDMVPLSVASNQTSKRAESLRRLRRLTDAGAVIGFFPEGHLGVAGPLGQPQTGATRFLDWLAQSGVTVLPVGVYEASNCLHARIGPPLTPDRQSDQHTGRSIEAQIMPAIAAQLPPALRGRWGAI